MAIRVCIFKKFITFMFLRLNRGCGGSVILKTGLELVVLGKVRFA